MLAFYNSNSKKHGDAVQNINKKQNAIYAYQIIPYFIQHIKQKTYKMFQMKYLAIWSKNISLLSAHSSNFCISDGTGVHQHLWNWHLAHVERHHQCCWRLLVFHEQLQSHAEQWRNMSLPKVQQQKKRVCYTVVYMAFSQHFGPFLTCITVIKFKWATFSLKWPIFWVLPFNLFSVFDCK